MQKLASYLIPIALVLMGLGLMATGSLARKASIPEWLFLLVAFAVFNLAVAYASGFWPNLAAAWSPSKSPFAVIGFALGLLPTGIAILFAYLSHDTFSIDMGKLTVSSALITLAIVSWEELWFRGIALEWGGILYSKSGAAVIFGLLFLGLHFLNPQINMARHALELFLAGYTLSTAYFLFGGIWAPIGMHYANNLAETLLKGGAGDPMENHLLAYTTMLAIVAIALTLALLRKALPAA